MIQHYIEWMYPGSFIAETNTAPVEQRDVLQSEVPRGAMAYRFFSREEVTLDGELLTGKMKDFSGWHYFGEAFTAEEAKNHPEATVIMCQNIQGNDWKRLVRTEGGRWYPLDDKDTAGSRP
jgi:hypothetical protein